jgi:hypothetical protein
LNTNEQYLSGPLLWIGLSLGVVFAVLFYAPFPLSIPLAVAGFVLTNFYLKKRLVKRMNMISDRRRSSSGPQSFNYSCINCGTNHSQIACPKCGSKMKRANFHSWDKDLTGLQTIVWASIISNLQTISICTHEDSNTVTIRFFGVKTNNRIFVSFERSLNSWVLFLKDVKRLRLEDWIILTILSSCSDIIIIIKISPCHHVINTNGLRFGLYYYVCRCVKAH